jgi:S-adenosylmethionine hydrolase
MQIVTLSTDIGNQDYLAGAIKGQLLSHNSNFVIADITHQLSQANFPQAAYVCSNAFKHFPQQTIHIIIINLFENPKQMLVIKYNGQFIICPDNGIATMIIGKIPEQFVTIDISSQHNILDITYKIATVIDKIEKGIELNELGTVAENIVEKNSLKPLIDKDWIEGQILFIDNFENVVINITKEEFEEQRKGRNFKIVFKRNEVIETISNNYASVNEGEKLAWFNSAGYLEIAVNKGNMAGLFGLQGFNEKMHRQQASMQNKWFYQTVRIFFE